MTLQEAVAILKAHNEWRRGGEGPMTDPTELGIAIDTVVDDFASVRKIELTWQDARRLVTIADDIADFNIYRNRHTGEEAYYKEVLRRFKEGQK